MTATVKDAAPPSNARSIAERAAERSAVIIGGSMRPTLEVGDWVELEELEGDPERGEVIAFRAFGTGELVCHRYFGAVRVLGGKWYVHRGDAPGARFGLVRAERVVGRVKGATRKGRPLFLEAVEGLSLVERAKLATVMVGAAARQTRWLRPRLLVSLRLRLDLDRASPPPDVPGLRVREVPREELDAVLLRGPSEAISTANVDRRVGRTWRAFVAFDDDGRLVHHNFVHYRHDTPTLFLGWTRPDRRNTGALRLTVRHIAWVLRTDGHSILRTSCAWNNTASRAALKRAGFVVTHVDRRAFVLGRNVRSDVGRLFRTLIGQGEVARQ